ncbi:MAG: hypothetical protein IIA54_06175, partial [Chloroflexi bacterium]|nr:hypothetical protein [Chloroflexota bacterium]
MNTSITLATLSAAALSAAALTGIILMAATPDSRSSPQPEDIQASAPNTPRYSKAGYDITSLPRDRVEQLADKLDEETYRITQ